MKRTFLLSAAVISLSLGACATGPYLQKEDRILALADVINRGGVNEVPGLSAPPFLFGGQIILAENHVAALWRNLHAAGFRLRDVRIAKIRPAAGDDYRIFGEGADVKTFFRKYVDGNTSIVRIESRAGTCHLLLNKPVQGYPRIQGFTGPFQ